MTQPSTVMIADDHPIFQQGLKQVIEKDPSLKLIAMANDGEEAWRFIQTLKPDIAILDIHMPRTSGLEVARKAAQHRLPVKMILLTMYEEEELFNEALNVGALAYVLKESAVSDLLQAIRCAIAGKHFVSPAAANFLINRRRQTEKLQAQVPGLQKLTPSERQILRLIADDRTSKEIAEELGISVRTVDTHRQNISLKLDLHGSHSLLKFAYDHKSEL
jgi:DNA-binding NarL/FixJ family response regulator